MAKFKTNTSSFTIAHYILLFLVTGLCICVIAWLMISRNNTNTTNDIGQNVIHLNSGNPCIKRTIDTIEKMWENDPKSVPQKYWDIAIEYLNTPIYTTTYGICQDVAFVCNTGQIRRDCDPCAIPSARAFAKQQQIADTIKTGCTHN